MRGAIRCVCEHALVFFGLLQGACIFLLSNADGASESTGRAAGIKRVVATKVDYTTKQMVRTPLFWVMYAMFVCVAAGGIIATAQIGPIAKEYGFAGMPVSVLGATLAASDDHPTNLDSPLGRAR